MIDLCKLFFKPGLLALLFGLLGGCSQTSYWTDEAKLGDGSLLKVHRYVVLKTTGGELSNAFKRWPVQYGFRVSHPATAEAIKWVGDDHVTPIFLDVDASNFYLIILIGSARDDATYKNYGCPDSPYVYLKRTKGAGDWKVIAPAEMPLKSAMANLSAYYDFHWMTREPFELDRKKNAKRYNAIPSHERIGFQAHERIEARNKLSEHSTQGFFQSDIPRGAYDWRYGSKAGYLQNGCKKN